MSAPIKVLLNDKEGVMFEVPSSSRDHNYIVNVFYDERGWNCGCEDHYFRKHDCKHIKECKSLLSEVVEDV